MDSVIACHECDLLHQRRPLPRGGTAKCIRCGAKLYSRKRNCRDRVLALTIAGLVLFFVANAYPLLTFKLEAQVQETTLISGIMALYDQGMWIVAAVVFLTSILVPLLQLTGMLYVILPLRLNQRPWALPFLFRIVRSFRPWGMMEVFMLGILVSFVKLAKWPPSFRVLRFMHFWYLFLCWQHQQHRWIRILFGIDRKSAYE